jgi:hypothetical protein
MEYVPSHVGAALRRLPIRPPRVTKLLKCSVSVITHCNRPTDYPKFPDCPVRPPLYRTRSLTDPRIQEDWDAKGDPYIFPVIRSGIIWQWSSDSCSLRAVPRWEILICD